MTTLLVLLTVALFLLSLWLLLSKQSLQEELNAKTSELDQERQISARWKKAADAIAQAPRVVAEIPCYPPPTRK